ncbi:MAG TPA: AbrB/MazE/SpoVT family DNA-binding domain-containing protein [Blastocatellia bacterium]|nr:AbrB/MazE/SpoVT family DNA-binding domain-containing protein [Blastocatellia bacterium]
MAIDKKLMSTAHLSENGELTIPAEYRRAHSLDRDSTVVMIEMGDALVLVPHDDVLESVADRLTAALKGAGFDASDLILSAQEARAEIVQMEFGASGEETH